MRITDSLDCGVAVWEANIIYIKSAIATRNPQLSLDSRYQLCWDAERMAAAVDLWNYQNSVMG